MNSICPYESEWVQLLLSSPSVDNSIIVSWLCLSQIMLVHIAVWVQLPLKTNAKKALSSSTFPALSVAGLSSLCVSAPVFSLNNCLKHVRLWYPFLLPLLSSTKLTLGGYLPSWVLSVDTQIMFLYASLIACLCFHCAYILFMCVSSSKAPCLANQVWSSCIAERFRIGKFFISLLYRLVVHPGYPSLCGCFPRNPNE